MTMRVRVCVCVCVGFTARDSDWPEGVGEGNPVTGAGQSSTESAHLEK